MFEAVASDCLVPFDRSFRVARAPTGPPDDQRGKKHNADELDVAVDRLGHLQRMLFAHEHHAVLLVFQAMDAGGKDSTIRAVMTGVNPAGCQVFSFKQPSAEELDHDFLWRIARRLPERGRIGIFNRSHYEEVLVVRVHPEFLDRQRLPGTVERQAPWRQRYRSIRGFERHLAQNGTVILKFWLNVSKDEQRRRFLSRIDEPHKNWKFAMADVEERGHWDAYMRAYEAALNGTSRPWAPWYAIPADDKPFMRRTVAEIVVASLESLGLAYPKLERAALQALVAMRERLEAE